MEKLSLSIIVPSIRKNNLGKLHLSICHSLKSLDFEMIIVGPYKNEIDTAKLKWIESYRSPNAAQQQGLLQATGDYITFAADDGEFLPGALDEAFDYLMWVHDGDILNGKEIVIGKYIEGDNPNPDMLKEDYYKFKYHEAYRLKGVPQNDYIFNCGIISRKFIMELGGWDATAFEATTCAHADLGIRAKKAGAQMILMDEPLFKCSHQPGKTGDHGPIHEAMKRDLRTFRKLYSKKTNEIYINPDNWEETPVKWSERFK